MDIGGKQRIVAESYGGPRLVSVTARRERAVYKTIVHVAPLAREGRLSGDAVPALVPFEITPGAATVSIGAPQPASSPPAQRARVGSNTLLQPSSCPPLLRAEAQDKLCRADYMPVTTDPGENEPVRHSSAGGINGQDERRRSASLARSMSLPGSPPIRLIGWMNFCPGIGRPHQRSPLERHDRAF